MHPEQNLRKMLRDMAFHSLGIVPIKYIGWDGINQQLASLPPEEARKIKRKFRKLWRKIAKHDPNWNAAFLGMGDPDPEKILKTRRRSAVLNAVEQKFVLPTLRNMKENNK